MKVLTLLDDLAIWVLKANSQVLLSMFFLCPLVVTAIQVDANNPPVVTSPSAVSVSENVKAVISLKATDADDDVINYSLSGGADQSLFTVNDSTGELRFSILPDHENPADGNKDNVYLIQVSASDRTDTTTLDMNVTVTDQSFRSIWRTSAANGKITLPLSYTGTYNFNVHWGDGSSDTITAYDDAAATHTYATAGEYTVMIDGTLIGWESNSDADKLLRITQWGDLQLGDEGAYFSDCENLQITTTDLLNTKGTTNFRRMFYNCSALTSVPGMNEWDVSKVTNMIEMFREANNFNEAIGAWDVSSVSSMSLMFRRARNFNQPIGGWDVSKVTSMSYMFSSASKFNQDIGNWKVTAVENMQGMFQSDSSFNQDIGDWDVSSVKNMANLFQGATSFNQDITNWNVSSVSLMVSMFRGATSFNQDISGWSTGNVVNMANMFGEASAFNQNLGQWDVRKALSLESMFLEGNLSTLNYDSILSGWSKLALQSNIKFGAGSTQFCDQASRDVLVNTYKWEISDGGKASICSSSPVITSASEVSINENSTTVLTVEAEDVASNPMTYNLSGGLDRSFFSINSSSGVLTFKTAPDFENPGDQDKKNTYLVQVNASNGTEITIQDMIITILNQNDTPPKITSDMGKDSLTISLEENKTSIMKVTATDPDNLGKIQYGLSESEDQALFEVDIDSGTVTFKAAPDYEAPGDADQNNDYLLQLFASDGVDTTVQKLTVRILNQNDTAPKITSDMGKDSVIVSLKENNTSITKITATDPDNLGKIQYGISGGKDQSLFAVDKNSGSVTFKAPPDYENPGDEDKNNNYLLQLSAADGVDTTFQKLEVRILNQNDTAPVFTSHEGKDSVAVSLTENDTTVTKVTATDPDNLGEIEYALTGGVDQSLFKIDGDSGTLSFKEAPDYENPKDSTKNNSYEVIVSASDGVNTSQQVLTISVLDENEEAVLAVTETPVETGKTRIYPNPADRFLVIEPHTAWQQSRALIISIRSLGGQVISTENHINKPLSIRLNISGLENGLYFVELKGDHQLSRYRFLVMR